MKTKVISLRISEEIHKKLKLMREDKGLNMNFIITQAIEQYLKTKKEK